jgi:hypothetical protein
VEGVRLYGGGTSTTLNVWNAWVRAYTYTRDDVQYVDHLQSFPPPFLLDFVGHLLRFMLVGTEPSYIVFHFVIG